MHPIVARGVAATVIQLLASAASGQAIVDTVLFSGDPVPGLGLGVSFVQFGAPSINASGQVGAWCIFAGPGVDYTNNIALVSVAGGAVELFARIGDHAPGTATGVNFSNTGNYRFSDSGMISAFSGVMGPGVTASNDFGHWLQVGSSLELLARESDAAPGVAGAVLESFLSQPAVNAAGQVAFACSVAGPGVVFSTSRTLYYGTPGSLSLLARGGTIAPGTAANFFGFSVPMLNSAGQAAFIGTLTGSGVTAQNDEGLWSGTPGNISLIIRGGDPAPGAAPALLDGFGFPWLTSDGLIGFWASLAGPGVTSANNQGIWAGPVSAPTLVARTGSAAPGTSAGVIFATLDLPLMSTLATVAFQATLTGVGVTAANDSSVWSTASGSLALVAREGDPAPGTSAVFAGFFRPQISASGVVLFNAFLAGPGVDDTNTLGLWALGADGSIHFIARTGVPFDVNDDPLVTDLRTPNMIETHFGASNFGGWNSSINDAGQIAFRMGFDDGTYGVFIAELSFCPGDFNSDGFVDFTDFDSFVTAFDAGGPGADFNGDGFVDFTDFDAFVAAFEAPC
jgi:hypothetical protein